MATSSKALLRGAFVPSPLHGRVASVHAGAVNILEEGSGLLVSLVARASDMSGRSVHVERLPHGLACGAEALGDGRLLRVGSAVIDLAAPAWTGRPPRLCRFSASRLRKTVGWLQAILRRSGRPGGLLGLLEAEVGDPFAAEARRLLASRDREALRGLVGLGRGLTPAGDDFLCGALAAETLVGRGRRPHRAVPRRAVRRALAGTTPAGRTLLALALEGSYPAYLVAFLGRLAAAQTEEALEAAVIEAAGHGESSGTDCLLGLLWRLGGVVCLRR